MQPPLLVKSQLRFATRHPVGPVASLVGVILAVLALVAVHLVSQSIRSSLDDPAIGGHTHVATRDALTEADYFELRQRWRDDGFGGVVAMIPVIEGFLDIQGRPQRIIGFDPMAVCMGCATDDARGVSPEWEIGADWEAGRTEDVERFLTEDVVIASPQIARDIARGEEDAAGEVQTGGGLIAGIPVRVIEADTGVIFADLPTAQRLLGREGEIDAVWIRAGDVRTRILHRLDRLLPGIAASLPRYANPVIDGFTVTPRARWNPARRFADSIVFNLGMLSLLCLLMAAFIAFQASVSNAARRTQEHQRLLAVGVSRHALLRSACAEGFVIGTLGAAIGLGLGKIVANALLQTAVPEAAGSTSESATWVWTPTLDAWVVGKALACGPLVSMFAPLAAQGRARATSGWLRLGIGLSAAAIAVAGLLAGSLGAAFVALFAICLVQVVHIVPLASAAAGRLAVVGKRLSSRSNLRAVAARSTEVRLALGALSVAAAVAIGMSMMVESLRRDFTDMLEVRLWEGVYVRVEPGMALETGWVAGLPGVREVRRYGEFRARLPQGPVDVRFARLDAAESARYGHEGPLEDRAMLSEVGARILGLGIGDTVTITGAGSRIDVEIAHVFRDFGAATPRMILPMSFHTAFDPAAVRWRQVSVLTDPDAADAVTATLSQRYGPAQVRNQYQIRTLAMAVFDRSFVVSRSLTVLALLVAAIGLYAALTALQASRVREFRLLSAVGHSRAELWRLAMWQTVALGTIAVVTAVPLGIAIAWVLCDFINPEAFGWSINLHFDLASISVPVLLGLAATLAAGAVPAYRASFRGEA